MFDMAALSASFGGFIWMIFFFVIALSVIVAVHEYGHYIVGRWCGIHAEVFSVGLAPCSFRVWTGMERGGNLQRCRLADLSASREMPVPPAHQMLRFCQS